MKDHLGQCAPQNSFRKADEMPPVRLCDSELEDQGPGLVEVRATSSMGNGLFATRDIPRGTRIIAEVPIIAISNVPSLEPELPEQSVIERDLLAFCAALQRLPQAGLQGLDQLYRKELYTAPELRPKVRQWHRDQGTTDANGNTLKGKKLQDLSKFTVKRFVAFLANRVVMSSYGTRSTGVFPLHSRMNHSCVPNTYSTYNPNIQRLTTHALRDIQTGEQLTISYLETLCQPFQKRKKMTEMEGFVCRCHACTDLSNEPLRRRIFVLDRGLIRLQLLPFAVAVGLPGPRDNLEALRDAEELVALLKYLGLEGMDLRRAYRTCSNYKRDLGLMQDAIQYAQKELELERCMIGTDTAHLRDKKDGAEYWLEFLQRLNNESKEVC